MTLKVLLSLAYWQTRKKKKLLRWKTFDYNSFTREKTIALLLLRKIPSWMLLLQNKTIKETSVFNFVAVAKRPSYEAIGPAAVKQHEILGEFVKICAISCTLED